MQKYKKYKMQKYRDMTFLLLRYLLAASQLPLTSRATFVLDVLSSLALLISYFLHLFRYFVSSFIFFIISSSSTLSVRISRMRQFHQSLTL